MDAPSRFLCEIHDLRWQIYPTNLLYKFVVTMVYVWKRLPPSDIYCNFVANSVRFLYYFFNVPFLFSGALLDKKKLFKIVQKNEVSAYSNSWLPLGKSGNLLDLCTIIKSRTENCSIIFHEHSWYCDVKRK